MKVTLFFVFIAGVLFGWQYVGRRTKTQVKKTARKLILPVVVAAVVTTALLALAFISQGKII